MSKVKKKTYKELATEFKKTRKESVYTELYHKMRPGLLSYINNIVKDPAVASDIVSTTLTTVYLKIDQYNEDYQITTWAYRIAYNECIGWIRFRNKKVSMNVFTDAGVEPPMEPSVTLRHDSYLPKTESDWEDEQTILDEQIRLTYESINALPPMYKRYMVERFLNHKSYSDILDIMKESEKGISLQTVKNRIFRGRKIIKKQLEGMSLFSKA
jgi:RNA polymerase sigma-70 factor (ECF subfamily)|tara:strand:- start:1989 stop:2627 length:639 start_codon:yes stop_codon:yes gene_type:complete